MDWNTKPASDYPLPDLTQLLNRSFENYPVNINFSLAQFLTMLRKDSIDLSASRVLLAGDQPAGIALIARRGWTSRLAAMGLAKESRGRGAGYWLMNKVIEEAREREDHVLLLEVIEQNEAAVRLYQKCGFQIIRRLIGFHYEPLTETESIPLTEIDLLVAGRIIAQYGLSDLPWQLTGETIAQLNPPAHAYHNDHAYVVISNPDFDHIVIWSVLVEPEARGQGLGAKIIQSVMAQYPGKVWHVPEILPEELGTVFERLGFKREKLSQWQMQLTLK